MQSGGDLVGSTRGQAFDGSPLRSATNEGAGDVHVDMWDGLVGRRPVVLPHRHSAWIECAEDGSRCSGDGVHHGPLFVRDPDQ